MELSSYPTLSNAGEDPEDYLSNSAPSDHDNNDLESLSGDPKNETNKETNPKIRSILASEDNLDLDKKLLSPSKNIWYDSLDEL